MAGHVLAPVTLTAQGLRCPAHQLTVGRGGGGGGGGDAAL